MAAQVMWPTLIIFLALTDIVSGCMERSA